MKKRINISIDEELYEESKKYISNLSAYLSTCIKRGIDYNKRLNKIVTFEKESNEKLKKEFGDIDIKDLMKELEEL